MRPVGEFLHSEFREPSLEAAALFKRLAAEGKDIQEEDRNPDIKLIKLCCMSCGAQNEFKEINTATIETCRKCNQPIFREEETKT